MTKWILNCIFPVMEWSTDTKTGYDDLEVYIEYGYVFVSSVGRNHAKMANFSFKPYLLKRRPLVSTDRQAFLSISMAVAPLVSKFESRVWSILCLLYTLGKKGC